MVDVSINRRNFLIGLGAAAVAMNSRSFALGEGGSVARAQDVPVFTPTPLPSTTTLSLTSSRPQRREPGIRYDLQRTVTPLAIGADMSEDARILLMGEISDSELTMARDTASLAKTMTALVTVDRMRIGQTLDGRAFNSNTPISISSTDAVLNRASNVRQVTAGEALEAMMVGSRNGMANALARHIGGDDVDRFMRAANEKAEELHMRGTFLINPSGLPSRVDGVTNPEAERLNATNVTCAEDLFRMAWHTLNHYPEIEQVTGHHTYMLGSVRKNATNHLFRFREAFAEEANVVGLKTGTTNPARSCFLGGARPEHMPGSLCASLSHGQANSSRSAAVSESAMRSAMEYRQAVIRNEAMEAEFNRAVARGDSETCQAINNAAENFGGTSQVAPASCVIS